MKYMHIGSVVFGLLFPLIPVITAMVNDAVERSRASNGDIFVGTLGFVLIVSPPVPCHSTDGNALFYSSTLPNVIITEIGVVLLILSIWLINKVYYTVCKYFYSGRNIESGLPMYKFCGEVHRSP